MNRGRGKSTRLPPIRRSRSSRLARSASLLAALLFKHQAYSNEAEYRFLQLHAADPAPEVKYRTRPSELVRYREFDWRASAPFALTKVVIGPAADRIKAARFARECLRAYHLRPQR